MNDLCRAYCDGKFNKLEYAEFHMALGYSVNGFCELFQFEDMEVVNPLWEPK